MAGARRFMLLFGNCWCFVSVFAAHTEKGVQFSSSYGKMWCAWNCIPNIINQCELYTIIMVQFRTDTENHHIQTVFIFCCSSNQIDSKIECKMLAIMNNAWQPIERGRWKSNEIQSRNKSKAKKLYVARVSVQKICIVFQTTNKQMLNK